MQPQETGAFDWLHAVTGLIGAFFGAAAGLITGVWRVARIEPAIRSDFEKGVDAAEKRVESKMDATAQHFDETLKGLRQKINDVELSAERRFLLKDDFNDFREEYRQDMRDLKNRLTKPHL